MVKSIMKRIGALVTTGLIMVSMLASCGKNDGKQTSSNDSNNGSNTQSESYKDLGGREIKVMLFGGEAAFTDQNESVYYKAFRFAEEKFNCKIKVETMPILELITAVEQAALAGTAPFDLAMVEGYHVAPKMALSGQYLCLSDYYDFKDGVWDNPTIKDVGVYDGKRYSFPMEPPSPTGIYYNKKLVSAANLPDPWTYIENNTWNWETFKKFAKSLSKKSASGQPEQFGFVSEFPFQEFILTNNAQIIDVSSGHGKLTVGEENSIEAINYVMSLYEENIMPDVEQIAMMGMETPFKAMTTGKVAMFPYHIGYGPYLMNEAKFTKDQVGWIYFPKGPKATEYSSPIASTQSQLMVLKNTQQPEDVVAVMKTAMAFWDDSKDYAVSFDDQCKTVAEKDMYLDFLAGNHLKMYQDLLSKTKCFNTLSYTAANDLLGTMFFEIREKNYTVSAGLDAFKSQIEAAIKARETVE